MTFSQRLAALAPERDTVVTVGVFDGVHQGHRHLLRRLVELAGADLIPAVVTFRNRPVTVLRPGTPAHYLVTPEQKAALLHECGIGLVAALEFTAELSRVTAGEFAELLCRHMRMKGLVLGPDSALGQNREGDAAFMREAGRRLGFWVESVAPLEEESRPVQSRGIREALLGGQVDAAARLLGRRHCLTGTVVLGDQRGRELGFPTANLEVYPDLLWPADGIYASWAIVDGVRRPAATSIGVRPTFGLTQRLVEIYIMDFSGDLYGQTISVEFVGKVRGQEVFDGVEALVAQIDRDVADCRAALAGG